MKPYLIRAKPEADDVYDITNYKRHFIGIALKNNDTLPDLIDAYTLHGENGSGETSWIGEKWQVQEEYFEEYVPTSEERSKLILNVLSGIRNQNIRKLALELLAEPLPEINITDLI